MEKRQVKKGWFRSLKWWQKLIWIDFVLAFCGLCIEDPLWAVALNVGNFCLSAFLLNKFVPIPED